MYASFMGKSKIIKELVDSPKFQMFSARERTFASHFGFVLIKLFGFPLETTQRLLRPARSIFLRNIDKSLKDKPVNVLDIGCSIGTDCFALARERKNWRILGVDIDKTSVNLANQIKGILGLENVDFRLFNILEENLYTDKFGIVTIFETLEHIKEDKKVIQIINKLLVNGGHLIVGVPYSRKEVEEFTSPKAAFKLVREGNVDGEFIGGYHWRDGYNEQSLTTLLEGEGFRVTGAKCVSVPKAIAKYNNTYTFPLFYPLSRLLGPFSKNIIAIVVEAIKIK
jgi:2-polyprenyl-3-methyl-5-hydroxy-6-metoxy-1,4-benzoquinol methylase